MGIFLCEQQEREIEGPEKSVATNLQQKTLRIHNGERIVSLTNGIGKLDTYVQKNAIGFLPYITCKYQLKMN